jgi:hypothetical protein
VPESFRGGCSFGAGATLTLVKPISPADATLFVFAPLVKMRPFTDRVGVHTHLPFVRLIQQVHTGCRIWNWISSDIGLRSHRNGALRWSTSPPDSTRSRRAAGRARPGCCAGEPRWASIPRLPRGRYAPTGADRAQRRPPGIQRLHIHPFRSGFFRRVLYIRALTPTLKAIWPGSARYTW